MDIRRTGPVLLVGTALLLAGCGSGQHASGTRTQTKTATTGTVARATATTATAATDAAQVKVIRAWAAALQRGDITAAAAYFAHPSVFANGTGVNGQLQVVEVDSEHDAELINESLSCGARLISTSAHRKYIRANFILTNRKGPGADCGTGTGAPAATDFVIKNGHIVDWIRAPASGTPTLPTPTTPTNPPSQAGQV